MSPHRLSSPDSFFPCLPHSGCLLLSCACCSAHVCSKLGMARKLCPLSSMAGPRTCHGQPYHLCFYSWSRSEPQSGSPWQCFPMPPTALKSASCPALPAPSGIDGPKTHPRRRFLSVLGVPPQGASALWAPVRPSMTCSRGEQVLSTTSRLLTSRPRMWTPGRGLPGPGSLSAL